MDVAGNIIVADIMNKKESGYKMKKAQIPVWAFILCERKFMYVIVVKHCECNVFMVR